MAFVEPATAVGQDELSASVTPACRLGTRAVTRDGRVFRYAQAGAVDLVLGTVVQTARPIAPHVGTLSVTAATGAKILSMGAIATTAPANYYAEGSLTDFTTGQQYLIAGHAAISTTAPWALTLETPLRAANPTTVGLMVNLFKGVILANLAATGGSAVGVVTTVIPANQYGWLLTWGMGAVLTGVAANTASLVHTSFATPGAVDGYTAANLAFCQIVGVDVGLATANGLKGPIFVQLGA